MFAGCNKEGIPDLVACKGTVTWKGKPVEGALVGFLPKDANGRGAFGMTDAQGKFNTTTLHTDDGIMPGEYFITVIKRTVTRGSISPTGEQITKTYFIPQIYAEKNTSGLSATISSKGTKDLLFELVGEIENRPTR